MYLFCSTRTDQGDSFACVCGHIRHATFIHLRMNLYEMTSNKRLLELFSNINVNFFIYILQDF